MAQRCTRPAALPSTEANRGNAAAALSEAGIQPELTRGDSADRDINQGITDGPKENANKVMVLDCQYADFRALTQHLHFALQYLRMLPRRPEV